MNKIPAVFLDRDGTLIEEVEYLKEVKDLKVYKDTAEAVKKLNQSGILSILVSNQSGVARGFFDENTVKVLNDTLAKILKEDDAYLDGFYYCPHHPKGNIEKYSIECDCRKPKAGLIKKALKDFENIDLKKSYVIGDKTCDVELAKNAGCKGILVKTGHGSKIIDGSYKNIDGEKQNFVNPDYTAENLIDAVNWILKDLNR